MKRLIVRELETVKGGSTSDKMQFFLLGILCASQAQNLLKEAVSNAITGTMQTGMCQNSVRPLSPIGMDLLSLLHPNLKTALGYTGLKMLGTYLGVPSLLNMTGQMVAGAIRLTH